MRIHHVLASVAIASAAALTAVAAPAQAAPNDHSQRFSVKTAAAACTIKPASVNMYTTARDITFDVPSATDPWLINDELFAAADPEFTFGDGGTAGPTWTFDPTEYANSEAGSKTVTVYIGTDLENGNADSQCDAPFSLKRGSKISAALKVSGGYRTLSGKVQSASWGPKPKYVNVNSGIVDVQKKLNGVWVTKKTVKTNSSGAYSAKIKAASGEWQAVFRGTSKIGSRTSATSKG